MRTVLIRTDGDHSLGMGHVYRSVSIAFTLEDERDLLKTMYEAEASSETGAKRSIG